MRIGLFAALEALVYLWNVPLCLAFAVEWRDGPRTGAALVPFDARRARRRAARAMGSPQRRKRHGRANLRSALRILRRSAARIQVEGRLGLGDAAATALVCGGLKALGSALPGLSVALEPDFGGGMRLAAQGMITARAGNTILAVARSGAEEIVRRMQSWRSAPSKRS